MKWTLHLAEGLQLSRDELQWILQRKHKHGWEPISFCRSRVGLETALRRHKLMTPTIEMIVSQLPPWREEHLK